MGRVEVFDHTADLGLRVTASDLDDLFQTAAEGLFDVVTADRGGIEPRDAEPVAIEAESLELLLIDWLNELIFRSETGHRLYGRFEVAVDAAADRPRLTGTIWGEPIDADRHILDHEVKAATHHAVVLREGPEGWLAEVIVDI
ncbi:archease [Paludisphaera borealis]|uniref:Protein archease n=1 Tax=Paludisphaera borealis TaxID=1387353 RepID=A0A1U7CJF2_9BACT|nr:archease [Paludisphaera borealis]APW59036.1 Protein archease [Paludisphaera borealis]